MKKHTLKSSVDVYFKKYVIIFYGVAIQSMGVALMYFGKIGSGPIAVMNDGCNVTFGISVGLASNLVSGVFILLALLFDRRYVSPATFLMTFGFGYMLDFSMGVLSYIFPEVVDGTMQGISLVLSTLLLGLGIGLVISANAGVGAMECVMIPISEKTGIPYKHLSIVMNVLFTAIGWLLGGTVGISTVVVALFSGYIISWSSRFFTGTVVRWMGMDGFSIE